ncbi:MAG: putative DNA-binding domain-containing protein [Pseudomonadota bacterium]|nr:putative DNA-binding domain-containing protein [Pseudomonadota bacterium]
MKAVSADAALALMQRAWSAALIAPDLPDRAHEAVPGPGWAGGLRTPEEGFAIYINNIRATLHRALEITFPATLRLVGRSAFGKAVLDCLREAPPASGDLGVYGAALVDRFAAAPSDRPDALDGLVVAEVARCEWLLDQLPRQVREPAWALENAATLPPECWLEWQFRPVAQSILFESDVPVRRWVPALQHFEETARTGECLLMVADESAVALVLPLDAAESAWWRELDASSSIQMATQAALDIAPEFELGALLERLLRLGALAAPVNPPPVVAGP